MKRYYFVLFLTLLCFSVHAQKSKNNCSEEEFKAKKQAYIAEQAGLTEEESAKFFPIYYELQTLKKAINGKAWKKARVGKDPQTTEVQYEDILNGFIDAEEQNCRLDKEYLKKYPNSNAIQIAEGLEIPTFEVVRFIDEGRLQFSKGKFERLK